MTVDGGLRDKASRFAELHARGGLITPNAWDAASAAVLAASGFPAVATTSAGIAFARGYPDGEAIGRHAMMREIAIIARSVDVPVSADIEAGYGPAISDVETTVDAVIDAGAVGINLEDSDYQAGNPSLFPIDRAAERVAAARSRAESAGLSLVINARTDVYLLGLGGNDEDRMQMAVERGRAYATAGANLIFLPGILEPDTVRTLRREINAPISLMAGRSSPPSADLFGAGASRLSVGPAMILASMGLLQAMATEIQDNGTWDTIERDLYPWDRAQALFRRS